MSLKVGALGCAALVAGPTAAHFELIPPLIGLGTFVASALVGLAAAAMSLVSWKKLKRQHHFRADRQLWGACLGVVPVLMVGVSLGMIIVEGHPRLNDVSTDRVLPPTSDNISTPYTDEVADLVGVAHPGVQPLNSTLSGQELFTLAVKVAERQEAWTVTTLETTQFSGYATSKVFHFKDDFVVRITSLKRGSALDIRSKSRDGHNDFGANAKRIKTYLAEMRAELRSYKP